MSTSLCFIKKTNNSVMDISPQKDIKKYRICICTRSMNISLYKKSMSSISLPYKRYRFLFTTADGYLYDLLKLDYDYVVNIDEDAFVIDNDALFDLIIYCITNEIVNCGMSDARINIREGNPVVTNPFFNIFDIRKIKSHFNIQEIKSQNINPEILKDHLPHHLINDNYIFKEYEPFYKYFVWLALRFKTLYLDTETHKDGFSTILKNQEGTPFLIHTWFSRLYGKDVFHTNRINNIMNSYIRTEIEEYKTIFPLWCYKVVDYVGGRIYYPLSRKAKRFLVLCGLMKYC